MMVNTAQDLYEKETPATQNQEAVHLRNLKKAQIASRRNVQNNNQYTQKSGAQNDMQTQTEAQKKQALKKKQRWHARMIAARKGKKIKKNLLKKQVRTIKGYNRVLWPVVYAAAFADAFFDILSIPILSTFLSFCTSLYINFALWSVGKHDQRSRQRIKRAAVLLLDLVPIINLIPFSVLVVYKTQEDAKKDVQKAKKIIKKISQT
jgi:hypothetical protein